MTLSKEQDVINRFSEAIRTADYPNTQWSRKIFYSNELEINGRMNRGSAPFVIFDNGWETDLVNVTYETDQGSMNFQLKIVISRGLIDNQADRSKLWAFDWEIQKALKTVEGDGLILGLEIEESAPEVLQGFITRDLNIITQLAVCADRSEY